MEKTPTLEIHANGAVVRRQDKRISFQETDKGFLVLFENIVNSDGRPACNHEIVRGKIRKTLVALTEESMLDLMHAYIGYKNSK